MDHGTYTAERMAALARIETARAAVRAAGAALAALQARYAKAAHGIEVGSIVESTGTSYGTKAGGRYVVRTLEFPGYATNGRPWVKASPQRAWRDTLARILQRG